MGNREFDGIWNHCVAPVHVGDAAAIGTCRFAVKGVSLDVAGGTVPLGLARWTRLVVPWGWGLWWARGGADGVALREEVE